mgnify:FL=1
MIALACTVCLLAGAAVTVDVAPDQPVPHVYVDDPVIIEIRSDADITVRAAIEIVPDTGGEPFLALLEPVSLRAHGAYWTPIEGVPSERGRYYLKARIETEPPGGGSWEGSAVFCRIDRPKPDAEPPFCAIFKGGDEHCLKVLKGLSVRSVRLDGEAEDLPALMQAVSGMGFQIVLGLTARSADMCEALAKSAGDRVVRWDIDAGPSTDAVLAIAKGLRRGGAKSPIAVIVDGPRMLQSMLAAGVGALVNTIILGKDWAQPDDVAALRDAAEALGYENMVFAGQLSAAAVDDPDVLVKTARQAIWNRMYMNGQAEVDTAFLYGDEFGPGYVCLSELPRRLNRYQFVGGITVGGVQTAVFANGAQWVAAFWSDEIKDFSFPVEKAAGITLYDARGNTLPPPQTADGAVALQAVAEPRLLEGTGGSPALIAVRERIKRQVAAFEEGDDRKTKLPPEVREAVRRFAQVDSSSYTRMDFFNLLKMFPRMEELWHAGEIPRAVAVPALADMAQLARSLCVLEQERGEPFVEPLQNTLANCGQFQSRYLTSSSGATDAHDRPDWLMEEVGRLMAEAERLSKDARHIEASAVATFAEWRARALEIAAKAQPLGLPEKELKPPEPPPVKKEETKIEEKKPAEAKPSAAKSTSTRAKSGATTRRKR